jgi:hypothetical protein
MDCICAVLASIANTVARAVNQADSLLIPTDFGDLGSSVAYNHHSLLESAGSVNLPSLSATHVAALIILLSVALVQSFTFIGMFFFCIPFSRNNFSFFFVLIGSTSEHQYRTETQSKNKKDIPNHSFTTHSDDSSSNGPSQSY